MYKGKKVIMITGASSGIGAALAKVYAGPQSILLLTARNSERLNIVTQMCEQKGSEVVSTVVNVRNKADMKDWIEGLDDRYPIDLVIANAGVSGGTGNKVQMRMPDDQPRETDGGLPAPFGEDIDQVEQLFDTNVMGVMNTIHPLIDPMRRRGRGHLAVMSSLASFRGFPGAPAYCASKAAVRVYGEALRGALREDGVAVSVICPGFVQSRMTAANNFSMPMLMDTDKAARIIKYGLDLRRARIAFPFPMYVMAWLLGTLPPWMSDLFLERTPKKS